MLFYFFCDILNFLRYFLLFVFFQIARIFPNLSNFSKSLEFIQIARICPKVGLFSFSEYFHIFIVPLAL